MKLLLMLAFPIYVVNVEVVLPAIQEAVFSQHSLGYLCPMNQLNFGQSPPQLQGERSSSPDVERNKRERRVGENTKTLQKLIKMPQPLSAVKLRPHVTTRA